ncbi:MAG TPA: RDD family protein [Niabella sp.]|nr:RDD family protein [Niabella sp.]HOZ97671.1 RDD family protein [Niabella sp.]HQW13977.1 RDD family protein [Niabella sp.]HQX19480.1 RDD family protein [Niabella sp.]HQX41440.1 RDD family protein [Niabella sp.]
MTESTNYNQEGGSNLFNNLPSISFGSFWERVAAAIIDGIILYAIGYILGMILGKPTTEDIMEISQSEGFGATMTASYLSASSIATLVINWLYYSYMESGPWQATLGKRALGLKVTGMNGERISFLNATGRYFAKIISAIILLIGYLMMLWDDKKQCLHDKMAGTLVVKGK